MFPVLFSECALGGYNVSFCLRMCSGRIQCFLFYFQNVLWEDTMFPVLFSECALGGYNVSCFFRMCSGRIQCFLFFSECAPGGGEGEDGLEHRPVFSKLQDPRPDEVG